MSNTLKPGAARPHPVQAVVMQEEPVLPNTLSEIESTPVTAAAMTREAEEIRCAILVAKKCPRNEIQATTKLIASMSRPTMASKAGYRFPRGGQQVEGPSVALAREAARCWGNIRFGLRIIESDDDNVHIQGWAVDLEANSTVTMEDKFAKLVYRKTGGWVKPDERDLRELVNRRGAITVRNALLQLLPPDVVEDAFHAAKVTLEKEAAGQLKQDPREVALKIATSFQRFGVSVQDIERTVGHPLEQLTATEVTTLRQMHQALIDGEAKPGELFPPAQPQGTASAVVPDATASSDPNRGPVKK